MGSLLFSALHCANQPYIYVQGLLLCYTCRFEWRLNQSPFIYCRQKATGPFQCSNSFSPHSLKENPVISSDARTLRWWTVLHQRDKCYDVSWSINISRVIECICQKFVTPHDFSRFISRYSHKGVDVFETESCRAAFSSRWKACCVSFLSSVPQSI